MSRKGHSRHRCSRVLTTAFLLKQMLVWKFDKLRLVNYILQAKLSYINLLLLLLLVLLLSLLLSFKDSIISISIIIIVIIIIIITIIIGNATWMSCLSQKKFIYHYDYCPVEIYLSNLAITNITIRKETFISQPGGCLIFFPSVHAVTIITNLHISI